MEAEPRNCRASSGPETAFTALSARAAIACEAMDLLPQVCSFLIRRRSRPSKYLRRTSGRETSAGTGRFEAYWTSRETVFVGLVAARTRSQYASPSSLRRSARRITTDFQATLR